MQVTSPLAAFRAIATTTAAQATVTTTAPSLGNVPLVPQQGTNSQAIIVVQSISASLAAGTGVQVPLLVSLIDGASGGTNVAWQTTLAAPANGWAGLSPENLNIPIYSGKATLEFNGVSNGAVVESVSMSGIFQGYGGS